MDVRVWRCRYVIESRFHFLCGMLFGGILKKLRLLPLGMLFIGILLGPYVFDWLDPMLLSISAELRQIAPNHYIDREAKI